MSMTLFALAGGRAENPFSEALGRWWQGRMDEPTLSLLDRDGPA
ncbi:uncharacterized protein (DUF1810 family) [Aquamicrobium terrae]|uniref:Uncharacterized protein (DUF1810 family) n=1 Tax=Aquamicrobium terrae TaxID=1324945 RepID=A0ABV2MX87_9HYPH